jgi:hypothetical protein
MPAAAEPARRPPLTVDSMADKPARSGSVFGQSGRARCGCGPPPQDFQLNFMNPAAASRRVRGWAGQARFDEASQAGTHTQHQRINTSGPGRVESDLSMKTKTHFDEIGGHHASVSGTGSIVRVHREIALAAPYLSRFLGGARGAATFATMRATGRNENARAHNCTSA